jgi:hypothetical protein
MTMMGAPFVAGPTVSQACATSARALSAAAAEIAGGDATRLAGGDLRPHLQTRRFVIHPNPKGPSGRADCRETGCSTIFNDEPTGHFAMVDTAENCARDWQIFDAGSSMNSQRCVTTQYRDALKGRQSLPAALHDPCPSRCRISGFQEGCRHARR